jgi:hypothetical protein
MALVRAADFPTYRILSSVMPGDDTVPGMSTVPITLTLSDGTTVTVCDQKIAALGLMEHMRARKQWFLQLSDDVFVISIDHTKMLFCENNLTLQRFNTSFNAIYTYGQVLFNHRTLSQQATLYEALMQSGQLFKTTTRIDEAGHLSEVNAVLVDWNWPFTYLMDVPALRYEATAPYFPNPEP